MIIKADPTVAGILAVVTELCEFRVSMVSGTDFEAGILLSGFGNRLFETAWANRRVFLPPGSDSGSFSVSDLGDADHLAVRLSSRAVVDRHRQLHLNEHSVVLFAARA